MDEFATVDVNQGNPPPEKLQARFNDPAQARVQKLPCALEGLDSKAVHFPPGVRTNLMCTPRANTSLSPTGSGWWVTRPVSTSSAPAM